MQGIDRIVYPLAEAAGLMEPTLRSEGGSDHVTFGEAEVLAVFATTRHNSA
jgi:hypothetical protein